MSSTFGFMDILIAICGVYLIYTSIQMKRTGEINSSVMVGKGYDVKKAKDVQGYIAYMYKKTIIIGVLVIISSMLDYLNETYWAVPYFSVGMCAFLLVIIIVFGKISMGAQKKYLSPK